MEIQPSSNHLPQQRQVANRARLKSWVEATSKRTLLGWAFTVLWLIAVAWMLFPEFDKFLTLSLNEKGDFIAGAAAPLAFLWLVLGYFQQGVELRQNTEALVIQAKQLQLQVQELKESVAAQERQAASTKDSVDLYRDELFASTRPQLQLIPGTVVRTDETPRTPREDFLLKIPQGISAHGYRCHWAFKNAGAHVTRARLEMRSREGQLCFMQPVEKSTWPKDDTLEFYIFCSDKSHNEEHLVFTYTDRHGKRFGCDINLQPLGSSVELSVGKEYALD